MIAAMKPLLRGLLLLAVCGTAEAAQLSLTEAENGKDLWMNRGDRLVIRLSANPSTGYDWSYSATKSGMLRQEGKVAREGRTSEKGMVGAPATELWTLKALRAGSLSIIFSYARPWEKGVPPARSIFWTVTIRC